MAVVVSMPKLSDTMEEGGIAGWLIKEGESVEEGDPLVEIETDKATQEYESPEEGVILKIIANPGDSVNLGEPICVVGEAGETVDLASLLGNSGSKSDGNSDASHASHANGTDVPSSHASTAPAGAVSSESVSTADTSSRMKVSPLAKRVAAEKGIDLAQLSGSGPNGRIILRDVEKVSASNSSPVVQSSAPNAQSNVVPLHQESSSNISSEGDFDSLPNSRMRKTIAKRLLAAKNDAPHFYLKVSVDMAKAFEWRKELNTKVSAQAGAAKVSVNDLILLATSRALLRHPEINASWNEDAIIQHRRVHLAVAVALPEGLVTPVIKDAHLKGLKQIGAEAKKMAGQAKAGELGNDAYAGGTFTISNLGMLGIEEFTAIINPPQAAILAIGKTVPTPAVDEAGDIEVQQRMSMTMSCDHRVIDGAKGAVFLQTLVSYLEDPVTMLV